MKEIFSDVWLAVGKGGKVTLAVLSIPKTDSASIVNTTKAWDIGELPMLGREEG